MTTDNHIFSFTNLLKKEFFIKLVTLLCLAILNTMSLWATTKTDNSKPNFQFHHIGTQEGLPSLTCMSIYISKKGYVWLATGKGLCYYDGNTIHELSDSIVKSNLFNNQRIQRIIALDSISLYLKMPQSIVKYNRDKGFFEKVLDINASGIYSNKYLYLSQNRQIVRFNPKNNTISPFVTLPYKNKSTMTTMLKLADSTMLIGTRSDGLYSLKGKKLTQILPNLKVSSLFEDHLHRIWIGSGKSGVRVLNSKDFTENSQLKKLLKPLLKKNIRVITSNKNGIIWIGTMKGLYQVNLKEQKVTHFDAKSNDNYNLSHGSVWDIKFDTQGTLWIGTYYGGVNYMNPQPLLFEKIPIKKVNKTKQVNPIVGEIIGGKKKNIWIATEGNGLFKYNRDTKVLNQYLTSKKRIDNIKAIALDKEENVLWVGYHRGGIDKITLSGKIIKHYDMPIINLSKNYNSISDIKITKEALYITTLTKVYKLDKRTDKIGTVVPTENSDIKRFPYNANDMVFDQNKKLWLGFMNGLVVQYDTHTGIAKSLPFEKKTHNQHIEGLGKGNVSHLFVDSLQNLWISTSEMGLYCYNIKNKTFKRFTKEKDNLPDDNIIWAEVIDKNKLLICTYKGISKYDIKTHECHTFDRKDGLPFQYINTNSAFITKEKKIYLGSVEELIECDWNKLSYKKIPFKCGFSAFYLDGKKIIPSSKNSTIEKTIPYTQEVKIEGNQHVLRFDIMNNNQIPNNKQMLEYRLKGFSNRYTELQGNSITYTNIPPGNYSLEVRSHNPSLCTPISMRLLILPPWYLTTWMKAIYILLILALIGLLLNFYTARLNWKNRLHLEHQRSLDSASLNQTKLQFFTNISHEFRTPLTLILSESEQLIRNGKIQPNIYKSLLHIHKNSEQLKNLINELLDFRKQEIGKLKIQVSKNNLSKSLRLIYQLFLPYAKTLNFHFYIDLKTENDIWAYYDVTQIRKVLNNLVANAMNHCKREDTIKVVLITKGDKASIQIKDTGCGIPAKDVKAIFDRFYQSDNQFMSQPGSGIGLALSKGIIEAHHCNICVQSTEGVGTVFSFELPLNKELFTDEQLVDSDSIQKQMTFETIQKNDLNVTNLIEKIATEKQIDKDEQLGSSEENIENLTPIDQINLSKKEKTILIVEDQPEILDLLQQLFDPLYFVKTASNGKEALESISLTIPDIVLSDIMMPVMDGIALCKEIKSNPDTCHVPVVLLTARTAAEHQLEGMKLGADDYILKPFNSSLLIARCNNLLNNRILLHEHFKKEPAAQTLILATNQMERDFLGKTNDIIINNLANEEFNIDDLAQEMGISRSGLFSKIKTISGTTPGGLITSIRLKKAAEFLLNSPDLNITEISFKVGFSSSKYFSKCFKGQFGYSPNEYRKKQINKPTLSSNV